MPNLMIPLVGDTRRKTQSLTSNSRGLCL